ncbi:Holliday junction resolvase RecU [Halanaerobacter jeridensis]|uniref:Holliday junction resolvase RecU n=1 Tax=Halanaerobacter jeridensis TaxID=706427 RepID=A0A939BNN9_9FIRM|nr:Holliday junction resolvase RecU [Halanaerobacter jeridensis]MBM7555817.1 recombination protein U [Halanaerobacter jeridensis]
MRYGNRGKSFEKMIQTSNQQYKFQNKAVVQKIPTPVKVLDINPQTGNIRSGFYEQKSTVDYMGTYQGIALAFEAKETNVETRFDLSNIKEHQYSFLKSWVASGGIGFILLQFSTLDEIYYLPFGLLEEYWEQMNNGGRKSIPYNEIAKEDYKITNDGMIVVDYLAVVDEIFLDDSEE